MNCNDNEYQTIGKKEVLSYSNKCLNKYISADHNQLINTTAWLFFEPI